ncbi:MAG: hypothetical protein IPG23_19055 [Burkholderiales bacterium]|nr:hypothetical protein [Burkholderiales bacterium]
MSIHKTTPEFNATFNYVCVPQSFAADGRQMDTVNFPDSSDNTTACELVPENHWLLKLPLYQYAIQDIVNHRQAIIATQPVSTRLSDRSIVSTFLQTYGLWEVDQPKGVWASVRFFVRFLLAYGQFHFRTEVDRRLRFRAAKDSPTASVPTVLPAKPAQRPAVSEGFTPKQEGEGV